MDYRWHSQPLEVFKRLQDLFPLLVGKWCPNWVMMLFLELCCITSTPRTDWSFYKPEFQRKLTATWKTTRFGVSSLRKATLLQNSAFVLTHWFSYSQKVIGLACVSLSTVMATTSCTNWWGCLCYTLTMTTVLSVFSQGVTPITPLFSVLNAWTALLKG